MNQVSGYISLLLMFLNVGLAAFVSAAPANSMPWWVIALVAAINAVVHAMPSQGISVGSADAPPKA
jgi:hypothetical protein